MAQYTKEQVALIQLTTAIELFNQKKYIPAIALAGAAEVLYEAFLKEFAKKNNKRIASKAEIDADLFEMYKDILGINNYLSYRNNTRNELKHHGDIGNKEIVKGNFKSIALNHISGAIINHKLRTNELPKSKIVRDFCLEQGIS